MLDKNHIWTLTENCIDSNSFIVDITVSKENRIRIFIDSFKDIKIEDCVIISQCIENKLDRDIEDFELEVSSAGLDHPFRVKKQYVKNIGKKVEIIKKNGEKIVGSLKSFDDQAVIIGLFQTEKRNIKIQKAQPENEKKIGLCDIKSTKLIINF